MADPPNENIFTGLMDEYYAECDEHISAIKRGLLALEVSYSQQVFDELFRAFHTIKGLSGMVAFRDAEQLAHKVESYLRAITLTSGGLLRSGIETLRASTNTLEQVISAHRLGRPVPDTSTLIKRIECLIPDESDSRATIPARAKVSAEGLSPEKLDQIAAAEKKGLGIWSFHFSPGPELIQRGVNINAVRARLKEAGELIHAVPKIVDKEKVVFEFILASSEEPGVFGSWEKDGIRFQPFVPMKDAELPSEAPIPTLTPPSMVRVDLSRLDDLMQRMGEVVIRKAHFSETLKGVEQELPTGTWRALIDAFSSMERGLRDLREGLMRIRMVPIADLFERMRFAISDLGALQKKRIRLEFFGQETEIDKFVVERMIDAMLHLVRNAVSHGIEDPEERASLGKPPEGRITLAASSTSEKVVLEITDDGRGIDLEVITNKAMSLGLIKPEDRLKSDRLLDIICETGFTTHLHADVASGRGIGMTVVRKAVEELGGSLELDTSPGKGSRFSMVLPLSLSIRKVLLVGVRDRVFAIPTSSIDDIVEIDSAKPTRFENNEIIHYKGGILPLLRLSRYFRFAGDDPDLSYALVVDAGNGPVGIVVDRLPGQREIVVHSIKDPLLQVPGVAGATELGDKTVVLILDVKAIIRMNPDRK